MPLQLQAYGLLTGIVLASAVMVWPLMMPWKTANWSYRKAILSYRKALLSCLAALPVLALILWVVSFHLPPGYGPR